MGVYQQVSSIMFLDVIEEVKDILSRHKKSGVITKDMATYAVPMDSKPARFYILQKVRMSGFPVRLIMSAVGSPTEGFSEMEDHFFNHSYTTSRHSSGTRMILKISYMPFALSLLTRCHVPSA